MNQLLFALSLLAPAIVFAQSPFDGTWKMIPDQSKFSDKPMTFSLNNGMYDSTSAGPKIHIKADGQDQPVSGVAWDTLAVLTSK